MTKVTEFLKLSEAISLVKSIHPWITVHIGDKKHHGATINYDGVMKHRLSHVIGMESIVIYGEVKSIDKNMLLTSVEQLIEKSKDVDKHIEMHNKYGKELQAGIDRLSPTHYDYGMNKRFLADGEACLEILHAVKENRKPIFKVKV
jgi:hypothetical protein